MTKTQKLEQLHKRMIEEIQDYSIILLDTDGTILNGIRVPNKFRDINAMKL